MDYLLSLIGETVKDERLVRLIFSAAVGVSTACT